MEKDIINEDIEDIINEKIEYIINRNNSSIMFDNLINELERVKERNNLLIEKNSSLIKENNSLIKENNSLIKVSNEDTNYEADMRGTANEQR